MNQEKMNKRDLQECISYVKELAGDLIKHKDRFNQGLLLKVIPLAEAALDLAAQLEE